MERDKNFVDRNREKSVESDIVLELDFKSVIEITNQQTRHYLSIR